MTSFSVPGQSSGEAYGWLPELDSAVEELNPMQYATSVVVNDFFMVPLLCLVWTLGLVVGVLIALKAQSSTTQFGLPPLHLGGSTSSQVP